MLWLGLPGKDQLDLLPGNVTGIPHGFHYHPFCILDWKEEAQIQKKAAQQSSARTTESQRRFYIDYGFMRASSSNYSRPDKKTNRVVLSYDGFSSYFLIVDKATPYIWCFLTKSKETNLLDAFFTRFGHELGGSVCTNQGGKLARSSALSVLLLQKHRYVLEPTGAGSPSQNGAVEIYNGKLAVCTRTLLHGSGLPAKYWSSALLHLVYLHNPLVHTATKRTPFKAYYGIRPDLAHLKLFGSWVCVKVSGIRHGKLGRHDLKGIILGYTATDQNIVYLDLNTSVVKQNHHAQFDEVWYLQSSRPPVAQLLYDIGIEPNPAHYSKAGILMPLVLKLEPIVAPRVPWPPMLPQDNFPSKWLVPNKCTKLPLLLVTMTSSSPSCPIAATATLISAPKDSTPAPGMARHHKTINIMTALEIFKTNMAMIYMSPNPYFDAFKQPLDLHQLDLCKHPTAGLSLYEHAGRLHLATMSPDSPAAKIKDWHSRVKGAWLIQIGDTPVTTITSAKDALTAAHLANTSSVTLLFAHPKIRPNLSHDGVSIVSSAPFTQSHHDQLNNRLEFSTVAEYLRSYRSSIPPINSGGVYNVMTKVMKLTCGKLIKGPDWMEWQDLEYLQLNQDNAQGMFGRPTLVNDTAAVFHTVWTYNVKALDHCKKARYVCDGSLCAGEAVILDETYANCVDQTSSRMF